MKHGELWKRRLRADLMLLACAIVWGVAFVFQKSAMSHMGPMSFVAGRLILAMLVLAWPAWRQWGRLRGRCGRDEQRRLLWLSVLAGLLFFAGMGLQQMGIVHATVTHTGFLTSLYVVLTPVAVWVILGRAPSFWVWMGVLLAGGGTWLLGGGKGLEGFGLGEALVAVSALFWAVYVVVVGLAAGVRAAMVFTWLQFLVAGILALMAAVILESLTWVGLLAAMPDLLFVGVLSSALMFTLFAAAMENTGPTETAVIASLEAIFAGLAAWWLLGEMLGILGWIGAAMLVLATLVVHIPAPQGEAE